MPETAWLRQLQKCLQEMLRIERVGDQRKEKFHNLVSLSLIMNLQNYIPKEMDKYNDRKCKQ